MVGFPVFWVTSLLCIVADLVTKTLVFRWVGLYRDTGTSHTVVPGFFEIRGVENTGGICAVSEKKGVREVLPLPIAGLMSDWDFSEISEKYTRLDRLAKGFGCRLHAPFMTLSFMALLVIPEIKLSDRGLFDGNRFEFMDLFA